MYFLKENLNLCEEEEEEEEDVISSFISDVASVAKLDISAPNPGPIGIVINS